MILHPLTPFCAIVPFASSHVIAFAFFPLEPGMGKPYPLRSRKWGNYSSTLESQIFNDEPHIHLETASFTGNFG